MSVRIVFASVVPPEAEFYREMAQHIRVPGVVIHHTSLCRGVVDAVKKNGGEATCFSDLLENTRSPSNVAEDADETIRRYGLLSLRHVYWSDRASRGKKEADLVTKTLRYFHAWEDYLSRVDVSCIFTELGGELFRLAGYHVARAHGIPVVSTGWAPMPNHLVLSEGYAGEFTILEDQIPNELATWQAAEVERFIAAFRDRTRPGVFAPPPTVSPERLRKLVRDSYQSSFIETGAIGDYLSIRMRSKEAARRLVNKYLARLMYERVPSNERYVFFPMHDSLDMQLTVRAPQCFDQEHVIGACSRALPEGYKLVVKEHPAYVGGVSILSLLRVARLGNVVLVPPEISADSLIKGAALIITINSTVGFEALVHGKPVVTLGESFYRGHGLTIDVHDWNYLAKLVRTGLNSEIDRDKLHRFLYAALNASYPGLTMYDQTEENLNTVASSLMLKLRQMGILNGRQPEMAITLPAKA